MEGNRKARRRAMGPFFVQKKKTKETEWIKKLRAVYQYGMNNNVGDKTELNKTELIVSKFPQHKRENL